MLNDIIKNETDAYILWAALTMAVTGYEVPYLKVQENNELWHRLNELMDELEYSMKIPYSKFAR